MEGAGIDVSLKVQEWAQFLEFLGPPPNAEVDVYNRWIGDYVDAMNFLELWTCLREQQRQLLRSLLRSARHRGAADAGQPAATLYAQLEQKLVGADGALPTIPIYWYVPRSRRSPSRTPSA